MYKVIEYENLDDEEIDGSYVLIDVRSPKEYDEQTIPGSINIPILDDNEREIVGTTYVQESAQQAKRLGVEFVSKKLPYIYDKVLELNENYDNLIFFCYRGGLRSSVLVSVLKPLGINAIKLNGGYKKYRKYVTKSLQEVIKDVKFVVLYGNTGTGKTDILKALKEEGMDVLDLERNANHRGSFFGSVGLGIQTTQKMFESLLYKSLKERKSNIVFVEGESKRIGKDIIPDCIFNTMKNGIFIKINASLETRINNILKDYVHDTDDELIESLNLLRRSLGNKNIDQYIEMIKKSEYRKVIEEIMIKYYDPLYQKKDKTYHAIFDNRNSQETAKKIIKWSETLK